MFCCSFKVPHLTNILYNGKRNKMPCPSIAGTNPHKCPVQRPEKGMPSSSIARIAARVTSHRFAANWPEKREEALPSCYRIHTSQFPDTYWILSHEFTNLIYRALDTWMRLFVHWTLESWLHRLFSCRTLMCSLENESVEPGQIWAHKCEVSNLWNLWGCMMQTFDCVLEAHAFAGDTYFWKISLILGKS